MGTQKRAKKPCRIAPGDEEAVRKTAADHGIELRVNVKARHWMFDTVGTGRRIANYWPSTGTVTAGGFRGLAESPWHAVEMAADLIAGKAPEDVLTGKPDGVESRHNSTPEKEPQAVEPVAAATTPAGNADLVAVLGKLVAAVERLANVIEQRADVRLSA